MVSQSMSLNRYSRGPLSRRGNCPRFAVVAGSGKKPGSRSPRRTYSAVLPFALREMSYFPGSSGQYRGRRFSENRGVSSCISRRTGDQAEVNGPKLHFGLVDILAYSHICDRCWSNQYQIGTGFRAGSASINFPPAVFPYRHRGPSSSCRPTEWWWRNNLYNGLRWCFGPRKSAAALIQ